MRQLPFPSRWSHSASSRVLPFAAMVLPAWHIGATLPRFFDLTRDVPITVGGPNVWAAVAMLPLGDVELSGLAMALTIGTAATLIAQFILSPARRDRAVGSALLAALLLPWLLPAASVLDFVPALLLAPFEGWRRRAWDVVACAAAGCVAAVAGLPAPGAFVIGIAIWRVSRTVIILPANDNALPLGPHRLYLPRRAA